MFRALLTRHASFDDVGATLAGRDDAVSLNQQGLAQANKLAAMAAMRHAAEHA